MNLNSILAAGSLLCVIIPLTSAPAWADAATQIGESGETYASSSVQCATDPATGERAPWVEAGLLDPAPGQRALVVLNDAQRSLVSTKSPAAVLWLAEGSNSVVVALSRRVADSFAFDVAPGLCDLPDTSGNTFSADGQLEIGASGKSSLTVAPGCSRNPATGEAQPFVNLFDEGAYLLNVSVNGIPLTQLSPSHPSAPIWLGPDLNVITAANGALSTDAYVRDGGDGSCILR